jgi:hypothetical protein
MYQPVRERKRKRSERGGLGDGVVLEPVPVRPNRQGVATLKTNSQGFTLHGLAGRAVTLLAI